MWHAKPSGSYGYSSTEGYENIVEMSGYFTSLGYTLESQAGIIGNAVAESGLNPWRWQSDTYNLNGGYGLFQFTPASGYIDGCKDIQFYAPNLSTSEVTEGAEATDGMAQLQAFAFNTLSKWGSGCWRSYWNKTTYADLYAVRERILNTYGSGSSLSMEQFKTIDNVYDATFAFLACFEGPAVPNMSTRYEYASAVYEILTGKLPDDPTTPTTKRKSLPIWMMLRPF